jgi:hypothetical protein
MRPSSGMASEGELAFHVERRSDEDGDPCGHRAPPTTSVAVRFRGRRRDAI